MAQYGVFAQLAGLGTAFGIDEDEGLTVSLFAEGALGVSGSAWGSIYIDPRDLDFIDNDPSDDFIDASVSMYLGAGTPTGAPIPITFQFQINQITNARFVSVALGVEGFGEAGLYIEYQPNNDPNDVLLNPRFLDWFSTAGEWARVNHHLDDYPIDLINGGYNPVRSDHCFCSGTLIDMWPIDVDFKHELNVAGAVLDQSDIRRKIWKKPIELIRAGDIVVSFDRDGHLVPGTVTRTFERETKIILDFYGTMVTPGHVYFRADSSEPEKYEALIDILRDDGVIKHQDGTLIRAATDVPVDSPRDGFVRAVAGKRKADGTFLQTDDGRIRVGTRFLFGDGEERKSFAVADLIEHSGGVVGEDELIHVGDGPGVPFIWSFSDTLPKPEDFVLACSGTTLEDIYKAAEWEGQGPRLPAPIVLDRSPVQPLKGAALSAMPSDEPLSVAHAPETPAKP